MKVLYSLMNLIFHIYYGFISVDGSLGHIRQLKIQSKYVFHLIFDYSYKFSLKYNMIKYSKMLQEKFDFTKKEFQKISFIIKFKSLSPESILENKNKLMQTISKNQINEVQNLIKEIIISCYHKEILNYSENNTYDYYIIKDKKMLEFFFENSIFINNTNLEIELDEKLINNANFRNYIEKALERNFNIFFTFLSKTENTNKINDLKIFNFAKLGLDFNFIKYINQKNILEFSYDGILSSEDFKLINQFSNMTHLKLKNNDQPFKASIDFQNLIFLSVLNCPSAEIIIESEEIAKNLIFFEFDDESMIKFSFNDKPMENKINFLNLEYLYFDYDIIDFNKSKKIKKLKDNKIELINKKMDFYLNLLLNCREISEIDLNVYQINKINKEQLNLFFEVLKSLLLKSLIISSSFDNDIVFNIIQSENIAKSCKKIRLYMTDFEIVDYVIKNYSNLEELEINIEAKIAKFRINTPNENTIKFLNKNLHEKYESFKSDNNWLKICENQKNRIKKLIINNNNFQILKQNVYCYSFSLLVELQLKNIPISVNSLPLFQANPNIYFPNLIVLIIRVMNYIDCENPYNINMNLIENEAIENFSENIDKIPKVQHLVLNLILPGIKNTVVKNMLGKILDLKFLVNLDFSINDQKNIKNNQLMNLFPKLKQKKVSLPSKLKIFADI